MTLSKIVQIVFHVELVDYVEHGVEMFMDVKQVIHFLILNQLEMVTFQIGQSFVLLVLEETHSL